MRIIFSEDKKIISVEKSVEVDVFDDPIWDGGSSTPSVYEDLEYNDIVDADIIDSKIYTPTNLPVGTELSLVSGDTDIAVVEGDRVTAVAAGYKVPIYFTANGYAVNAHYTTFSDGAGIDVEDSINHVAGSFPRHVLDAVKTLINGVSPSDAIQYFLATISGGIDSPVVTLNESNFARSLDFSGTGVMGEGGKAWFAPAMITARHALVAHHVWGNDVGNRFVFMKSDGTLYTAEIEAYERITTANPENTGEDLAIIYFTADVPAGVAIYKVLPENWDADYAPSCVFESTGKCIMPVLRRAMHTPSSVFTLRGTILINTLTISTSKTLSNTRFGFDNTGEITSDWGVYSIPGDSGSPSFLLINAELILITTQTNANAGNDIPYFTSEINTAMNAMANVSDPAKDTYALTHVDLSSFTKFT